jgi:L-fuconolactonase
MLDHSQLTTHHSHKSSEIPPMKIDSHQHFWKFDPVRDAWITNEMRVIQKDFLPEDLQPVLSQNGIDGCVLVQTDQTESHNEFLIGLASGKSFIKGIVGWVDLQSENIRERLRYYKQHELMKGFRHILQGESDRALMLKPAFMRGIEALKEFDYAYDILIYPDQLPYAKELVTAFPTQKFVIDHLAKPRIRENEIDVWKKGMIDIAQYKNVYCKISGMVTESDWKRWKKSDFSPYLDTVTKAFGIDRIMYGSDWPVCLVAATYKEMMEIVNDYYESFSNDEQQKIFGKNAIEFYNLK